MLVFLVGNDVKHQFFNTFTDGRSNCTNKFRVRSTIGLQPSITLVIPEDDDTRLLHFADVFINFGNWSPPKHIVITAPIITWSGNHQETIARVV